MPTRPERKILMALGLSALLVGGVRLWRSSHPSALAEGQVWSSMDADAEQRSQGDDSRKGSSHRKRSSSKRSKSTPSIDSTSIIDLDRASVEQIEALGVLKANGARLIVANRDSFGAFGSMEEVERIPYLTHSEVRKLARRVRFSSTPRPRNTVMPGRTESVSGHRNHSR